MTAITFDLFKKNIKQLELFQKKITDERIINRKKGVKYISNCGMFQICYGLDKNKSTFLYVLNTDKSLPSSKEYVLQINHGNLKIAYGYNFTNEQLYAISEVKDNMSRFSKDKPIALTSEEIRNLSAVFNFKLDKLYITKDIRMFC